MKESEQMDSGHWPMDDDDREDRNLRALFERSSPHAAEQPFVNEVARRVAAARRRRALATRMTQALVVGALIAASPWLVSGSVVLSTKLDALFSSAARALDSPLGYAAGLVFVIAALVFRRRLLG
jgi:hypothetical protein